MEVYLSVHRDPENSSRIIFTVYDETGSAVRQFDAPPDRTWSGYDEYGGFTDFGWYWPAGVLEPGYYPSFNQFTLERDADGGLLWSSASAPNSGDSSFTWSESLGGLLGITFVGVKFDASLTTLKYIAFDQHGRYSTIGADEPMLAVNAPVKFDPYYDGSYSARLITEDGRVFRADYVQSTHTSTFSEFTNGGDTKTVIWSSSGELFASSAGSIFNQLSLSYYAAVKDGYLWVGITPLGDQVPIIPMKISLSDDQTPLVVVDEYNNSTIAGAPPPRSIYQRYRALPVFQPYEGAPYEYTTLNFRTESFQFTTDVISLTNQKTPSNITTLNTASGVPETFYSIPDTRYQYLQPPLFWSEKSPRLIEYF